MSILSKPYFHDEPAAFAHLEAIVWNGTPNCPKCGAVDRIYVLDGVKDKKGRERLGLKKCGHCKAQFTVRVGTVFESAHIPLHKILQAVYLMCASKKGISAHQMHRTLEITYKSAWFLCHRIRLAMQQGVLPPMGGVGETVEVDETYIGKLEGVEKQTSGGAHKNIVLTLVQRGGESRSFHVASTTKNEVHAIVRANLKKGTTLMTDEGTWYGYVASGIGSHFTVNHSKKEYVRYDRERIITTNTVEGFYSIFKRGMKGVYQHCGERHLHRYLAEFDFRYSNRVAMGVNDGARAELAIKGIVGKRLTYQTSG